MEILENFAIWTWRDRLSGTKKEVPPMPKQPAFPGLCHAMKKKQTRGEKFLAEMEEMVPWTRLLALIGLH
jgi:hypothetical protein